jgi:uncharacterized protein
VPTLQDWDVTEFGTRTFEKWRIGQAKTNNGVLLTVAMQERKIDIKTGYGVEQYITDETAGSIIRDVMVPRMKAKDYAGAVDAGTNAIMQALFGKFRQDKPKDTAKNTPMNSDTTLQ